MTTTRDVYNASTVPQPVGGQMLEPGGSATQVEISEDIKALADDGTLILSEATPVKIGGLLKPQLQALAAEQDIDPNQTRDALIDALGGPDVEVTTIPDASETEEKS